MFRNPFSLFLPSIPFLLAFSGLGCSGTGEDATCSSGLLAGDLVITEIMANPAGQDEGQEWFEVFNPGSTAVQLKGLRLESARTDGTAQQEYTITDSLVIEPAQYMVFGGVLDQAKPSWVDFAYQDGLGGLRNSGGRISLYCQDALVDRVVYMEMGEGISKGFDGSMTPDAVGNDDPGNWCDSRIEFQPGSFGTPGTANEVCGKDIPPDSCRDGDAVRDVMHPGPGDLVISEFMPNPSAVDDGVGEWFEVYVGADMDLNGLKFGKTRDELEDQLAMLDCIHVTAGSYILFGRSLDSSENGGMDNVQFTFDFSLGNSTGELYLGYGTQILDGITWTGSNNGSSTSLEPMLLDSDLNDDESVWCKGTIPYGLGDLGTPGMANPSCGISPPGKCYENGEARDLRPPSPGELIITEFMPNPSAVPDSQGEWFEVYVGADMDLNGIQVGKVSPDVLFSVPGGDCLPASAGSYVVFAQSDDPLLNGGLPKVDVVESDLSLGNSGGGIFLAYDDQLLDAITYSSSYTGAATALEPKLMDAELNDDESYWCKADSVYGDGDMGSPGAENPSCGIAPAGKCYEQDGTLRDLVPPSPGDIVFNEFMPDPSAAPDATGEWIELYINSDVDLNNLQIGKTDGVAEFEIPGGDCKHFAAGSYVVLARSLDQSENGNLPRVDFVLDMSLTNSGGSMFAAMDGQVLDSVVYSGSSAGISLSLDPSAQDTVSNDDEANWCGAVDAYGDGDLGTPGSTNPGCN